MKNLGKIIWLMFFIFLGLRIFGFIKISYWYIFSPLWLSALVLAVGLVVGTIYYVFKKEK